jgi:hypothetical protein
VSTVVSRVPHVFVSATSRDLAAYRKSVVAAFRSIDVHKVIHGDFRCDHAQSKCDFSVAHANSWRAYFRAGQLSEAWYSLLPRFCPRHGDVPGFGGQPTGWKSIG